MSRKNLIIILFIISLMIIIAGLFQIKANSDAALDFGKDLFDGKISHSAFNPIGGFPQPILLKAKTILVLFSPDCGACYNQVLKVTEHHAILDNYNLILASPYDSLDVMTYLKKFRLDGFKSLTVTLIDKASLRNHYLTFPSVILYDQDGYFIKGYNGGAEIKEIVR